MTEVTEKPAKATKAKASPKVLTLGAAADKVWAMREEKRILDAQVKKLDDEIKELTQDIFGMLDAQDTTKGAGKKASISSSYAVVPNATDWDATWAFIMAGKRGDKTAYLHLLRKQIGIPAYVELRGTGIIVPGQEDFTKRTLSIRSL